MQENKFRGVCINLVFLVIVFMANCAFVIIVGKKEEIQSKQGQMHICPWPGCNKVYGRRYHLNRHYSAVHEGKRFICEICGRPFANKSNQRRHARKQHENNQEAPDGHQPSSPFTINPATTTSVSGGEKRVHNIIINSSFDESDDRLTHPLELDFFPELNDQNDTELEFVPKSPAEES